MHQSTAQHSVHLRATCSNNCQCATAITPACSQGLLSQKGDIGDAMTCEVPRQLNPLCSAVNCSSLHRTCDTLSLRDGPMVVHTCNVFQYVPLAPGGLLASTDS
jgi:hypothetical protein